MLANVPCDENLPEEWGVTAVDAAGKPLAAGLVHRDSEEAWILLSVAGQAADAEAAVYYGGAGASRDSAPQDPAPVKLTVLAARGKSPPNSWAKMLYLYRNANKTLAVAHEKNLASMALPVSPPQDNQRTQPPYVIVRFLSFLSCPEDGVYRFGIDCEDAGFLLIDGELIASWPGEHPAGAWREGAPLFLKAGPHRVSVLMFTGKDMTLRLGWQPPGAGSLAQIPAENWIAGEEPACTRIERIDRVIHAGFTWEAGAAYAFNNAPHLFVPVTFTDCSASWIGDITDYRWSFGDGAAGNAAKTTHTYAAPGTYRAVLTVRNSLGFEAAAPRVVDCRHVTPNAYAFSVRVSNLPSICYPGDPVEPFLTVSGEAPPGAAELSLSWQVELHGALPSNRTETVVLKSEGEAFPLASTNAAAIRRIGWRAEHCGETVAEGTVLFLRPPFEHVPVRAEGNRLFDEHGRQLVLVPLRAAHRFRQPPITLAQAFGHIVCIDDFMALPGPHGATIPRLFDNILARIVDGPDRPIVTLAALPDWKETPSVYGPLLKFVQTPPLVAGMDVAVLSLGLQELESAQTPEVFERHVAALTDLVSCSLGCPAIWVTPPPYPPDPARVRPYAAAIRRAADARAVPVADLFTAFIGMRNDASIFLEGSDRVLSQQGQQIAAQLIAQALLQH